MREFSLQTDLFLPRPREEVFPFFAEVRNLETITPDWLRFEVLTPDPVLIRAGTTIDYRLRVRGIPIRWRSEITVWEPPFRFVDVQVHGPYRLWHHTHIFEERGGGTMCIDRVRYSPRGGRLMYWLFVRRDVERIFTFRQQRLAQLFPAISKHGPGESNN